MRPNILQWKYYEPLYNAERERECHKQLSSQFLLIPPSFPTNALGSCFFITNVFRQYHFLSSPTSHKFVFILNENLSLTNFFLPVDRPPTKVESYAVHGTVPYILKLTHREVIGFTLVILMYWLEILLCQVCKLRQRKLDIKNKNLHSQIFILFKFYFYSI